MKDIIDLLEVNKDELPSIYCDMDQVLCNFMKAADKAVGGSFVTFDKDERWNSGKDPSSKSGKMKWLARETKFKRSKIHLVMRSQKQQFAKTNGKPNVLVDDYIKNIKEWESKGGIGVHHTSVSKSIGELNRLGFK